MAMAKYTAGVVGVSLAANTVKTLVQVLAPANQCVRAHRFRVEFEGAGATAKPARVRALKQTTAGTASSLAPSRLTPIGPATANATAQQTFTAEPTAGDVLWVGYVPVFCGIVDLPLDVVLSGGERVAIDVLTATGEATVNAGAGIDFEE